MMDIQIIQFKKLLIKIQQLLICKLEMQVILTKDLDLLATDEISALMNNQENPLNVEPKLL